LSNNANYNNNQVNNGISNLHSNPLNNFEKPIHSQNDMNTLNQPYTGFVKNTFTSDHSPNLVNNAFSGAAPPNQQISGMIKSTHNNVDLHLNQPIGFVKNTLTGLLPHSPNQPLPYNINNLANNNPPNTFVKTTIPLPNPLNQPILGFVKNTIPIGPPPMQNNLLNTSTNTLNIVPNSLNAPVIGFVKTTIPMNFPPPNLIQNNTPTNLPNIIDSSMPGVLVKSTIPLNVIPMNAQITAVKITSPSNSFTKNIFKPDAKIDSFAKLYLGINPQPIEGKSNIQFRRNPTLDIGNDNENNNITNIQNNISEQNNTTTLGKYIEDNGEDHHEEHQLAEIPQNETTPTKVEENLTPKINPKLKTRKEGEDEKIDEKFRDHAFPDDDDDDDDDDDKSFIQKHSNFRNHYEDAEIEDDSKIFEKNLDEEIDQSINNEDSKVIKENNVKKLSIEEIKNSAIKFMHDLKNKIEEYKNTDEKDEEPKEKLFTNEVHNLDLENSFISKNNSKIQKNSNNLINMLQNDLKTLDEQFFKIKNDIFMNIVN
jgi:hypothetical protein